MAEDFFIPDGNHNSQCFIFMTTPICTYLNDVDDLIKIKIRFFCAYILMTKLYMTRSVDGFLYANFINLFFEKKNSIRLDFFFIGIKK